MGLLPDNADAILSAEAPPDPGTGEPGASPVVPPDEPTDPPAAEPVAPAAPAAPEAPDATVQEADEMLAVLHSIDEKLTPPAAPPAPPAPPEVPPDFRAMLEHEDPAVQQFARGQLERERQRDADLANMNQRLGSIEERDAVTAAEFEINTARTKYGLSDEQADKVTDFLTSDQELARRLTFDAGVRMLFPDVVARTMGGAPQPAAPRPAPGPGQPQAGQVITPGGAAGAIPKPYTPGQNSTIESATAEGAKRLLGAD